MLCILYFCREAVTSALQWIECLLQVLVQLGHVVNLPHTDIMNNTNKAIYKYLSHGFDSTDLLCLYMDAYPLPPAAPLANGALDEIYTLSSTMKREYDAMCPNQSTDKCYLPNEFVRPDVCFMAQPNPNNDLLYEGITVEVIGHKDVWGRNQATYKGLYAGARALAFLNRAYVMFINDTNVEMIQMTRNSARGKIDLLRRRYQLSDPAQMTDMFDDLIKAALDVFLTQQQLALATSNAYHAAGFTNNRTKAPALQRYQHFVANIRNQVPLNPFPQICAHVQNSQNIAQRRQDDAGGAGAVGNHGGMRVVDPY